MQTKHTAICIRAALFYNLFAQNCVKWGSSNMIFLSLSIPKHFWTHCTLNLPLNALVSWYANLKSYFIYSQNEEIFEKGKKG